MNEKRVCAKDVILKRSIAIVLPELLPVPAIKGGAIEHWVDEASDRLRTAKRRLAIVSRPAGIAGLEGIEYIGIPWTKAESFCCKFKERAGRRNPLRYLAKIQNVTAYALRAAEAARSYDLIYIHNEPNILLFLRKTKEQKVVLHMHNDHLSSVVFRPLYRRALAKVDRVLCVSDFIRQSALKIFPEYAKKFKVIINSTDHEVFRPYGNLAYKALEGVIDFEPSCRYLLFVGRLTEFKGVHVLVEAFAKVYAKMPNVRLIIAGSSFFDGSTKTRYEKNLVDLSKGVANAMIFTGFLPHEKLRFLYSAADVVCLPSIWQDPCPLVMFEALSSGTCLVASCVGGVPEVVQNGDDGILVEPNDANSLANAILDVLIHPDKKALLEQRGREKILKSYSWDRLVNEIEAEFENLK